MARDSKARMVRSAAALIRRRGVTATSFADVVAASGAPRGSIYHHFPEGKDQLAADAIALTSGWVLEQQRACPARTPAEVIDWFVAIWRRVVVESDGAAGCVVAGVAVDTERDAVILGNVDAAFTAWIDLVAQQLKAAGMPRRRAQGVATAGLAAMEGALILCRARRSVAPLDVVALQLRVLVE